MKTEAAFFVVEVFLLDKSPVSFIELQISNTIFTQLQNVAIQSRKCLGHEECVEILLNNGAKIDAFDESRQTPLYWAVKNGHAHIVKLLLKCGATIDTVIFF
jgi:ankyrin repeat protein